MAGRWWTGGWGRRRPREPAVEQQPGWPDLREFTEDAEFYYRIHHDLWTSPNPDWSVRAPTTWGLIARGADSLPYVRLMLASSDRDVRADGAGVLGAIAQADPNLSASLISALRRETDTEVRDTLIVSLGALKAKDAVEMLGEIVSDSGEDPDTRHLAADALGLIVRVRFVEATDPVADAARWWSEHRERWIR